VNDDERTKARILRGIVAAVLGLGLLAFVLALMPAIEVWKDMGPDFGWRRVDARSAAEHPASMIVWGLFVVGPGVLVWFRPRLTFACLWSLIALGATTMWFVVTADMPGYLPTIYVHYVSKWPAQAFDLVVVFLVGSIVVALPVFCGAFAFITGRLETVAATLPAARVVRR
jgi:hypothetical protein